MKAIQFMIETQLKNKTPYRGLRAFVEMSIVDQLERSGFIDSIWK